MHALCLVVVVVYSVLGWVGKLFSCMCIMYRYNMFLKSGVQKEEFWFVCLLFLVLLFLLSTSDTSHILVISDQMKALFFIKLSWKILFFSKWQKGDDSTGLTDVEPCRRIHTITWPLINDVCDNIYLIKADSTFEVRLQKCY